MRADHGPFANLPGLVNGIVVGPAQSGIMLTSIENTSITTTCRWPLKGGPFYCLIVVDPTVLTEY